MIPCSCAASSASAICFAIGSASSIRIEPRAIRCDRSSPSTSSITSAVKSGVFETVDRSDVRMVESREHFGFALKTREPVRIAGDRRGEHLDRHRPFQIAVGRAVDFAHAAGADLRGDFVDADTRAGGEGQTAGSMAVALPLATSRELFRFPRTTRDLGGPKTHVNPAAAPRSVEHAALGAPVRRTQARPPPP